MHFVNLNLERCSKQVVTVEFTVTVRVTKCGHGVQSF